MRSAGRWGLPVTGAAIAGIIWWLAAGTADAYSSVHPIPPRLVESLLGLQDPIGSGARATLTTALAGFALAAVTGIALAAGLGTTQWLERTAVPLAATLDSLPKLALVPLLVLWTGQGYQPKLVLVALVCVFPVTVSTIAGLASTPAELLQLARSMSASRWQTLVKIRFHCALPQIFVGFRVALPLAVIGTVLAEIADPVTGLGAIIVGSGAGLALAAGLTLAFLSTILCLLVIALERLLLPWAGRGRPGT